MAKEQLLKNWSLFLFEIVIVFLMMIDWVPLEAGLILSGLILCYLILSPLIDSVWLFIVSSPLFVALPFTVEFDSMASWRIFVLVLFLKWFYQKTSFKFKPTWQLISQQFKNRLVLMTSVFLAVCFSSLLVAQDPIIGLKKIIFLVNIGLLFFPIRDLVKNEKESLSKIVEAVLIALGLILLIGYGQLISVFMVTLFVFWKSWAAGPIVLFYGSDLANVLTYSNTWFSYFPGLPPTLRMFSVFPDSHSMALFCLIGLIYLLPLIYLRPRHHKKKAIFYYFFLILTLAALIFSGSRGVWVSALLPLGFLVGVFSFSLVLAKSKFLLAKLLSSISQEKVSQLILGSLLIFFLLFPLTSWVMLLSQKTQMDIDDQDYLLAFSRAKSAFDFEEVSVKSRLQIWQKTFESISRNPILGVGIGNYPVVLNEDLSSAKRGASAHNLYLDVFSEVGFLGLFVFLLILVEILKTSWRIWLWSSDWFKYFGAAFFIYFIWILSYSLFDVVLFNDKVLLFFVISLGILYGAKSTTSDH